MKLRAALSALFSIALAACGGSGGGAGSKADQLDNAASQSDPAAASVLHNQAEAIRDGNSSAGDNVQAVMENAGNAQATTVPQAEVAPPSKQAVPHRSGQPTPPPKTRAPAT